VQALQADNIEAKLALDPDRVRNVEAGVKGILRTVRLQYDMSLYDLRYKNFQTGLNTSRGIAAFASLGDVSIRGLDLQVQWTPLAGLSLGFAGDVNNAHYKGVNPAVAAGAGAVSEGSRPIGTPRYTGRLDVNYSWPMATGGMAFANAAYSISGKRQNQSGAEAPVQKQLDLSVGARKGAYRVELYGTNLTNEYGPWFIRQPGLISGPVPRTLGVRLRGNFD
jgi:outer membrane receptor for ferric coprogen and ferric-rhodotorulic acid